MQHRQPPRSSSNAGGRHRATSTRLARSSTAGRHQPTPPRASRRSARASVLVAICGLVLGLAGSVAGLGASSASGASPQAQLIASDVFHRTVRAGLGRADLGGAYELMRPSNVAVKVSGRQASVAGLKPGQSVAAELPSVSAADTTAEASLVVPTLTSRYSGLYFGLELRKQKDGRGYRAQLGIGSGGRITVAISRLGVHRAETTLAARTLSLRVNRGQVINLEGTVSGSTPAAVAVRVWTTGAAVPGWQLSARDTSSGLVPQSGAVAEWAYVSRAGQQVNLEQRQLRVWSLQPSTGKGPARPSEPKSPSRSSAPTSASASAPPSTSAAPPSTSTPPPSTSASSAPPASSAAPTPPPTTSAPPSPPTSPGGELIFEQNYDSLPASDPVSVDTERRALGDPTLNLGSSNLARSSIVPVDGRGNVMRITMPANTISEASGAIIDAKLPKSVDEASIQYDIRFGSNFDWSRGGKLPGLGGAVPGISPSVAGGCNTGSSDAWSGRGMWITPSSYPSVTGPNEWVGYLYDYNKTETCGDNLRTGKSLTAGAWHTVKQYYKLNTINSDGTPNSDGVDKIWIDGTLVEDSQNVQFRNNPSLHINTLYWEIFRGGGDMSWASPTKGTIDFDNLMISSG